MKTAPLIHTYKEIPDFKIIGERLIFLEDYLRVKWRKTYSQKNPITLKKIWPLLVKDVALLLHILFAAIKRKKRE